MVLRALWKSSCVLVCHHPLRHLSFGIDRAIVGVSTFSDFIFQVFDFFRDFDLEYQNLLAEELECTLYCVSLNEGLLLWWMDAFLAIDN